MGASGFAFASTARCDGGDAAEADRGGPTTAELEALDRWLYALSAAETSSLLFPGRGAARMDDADRVAVEAWYSGGVRSPGARAEMDFLQRRRANRAGNKGEIMRLRAPYESGWFTVILPTLICLVVWAGLALGIPTLLGWNIPGWLGTLLCLGGFVPGLAVAVVTYRLLLRLAERGRGEIALEGDRLSWRAGRRRGEIDFTHPHKAAIAAGFSGLGGANASVTLYPTVEFIHMRGIRREQVLQAFPAPHFVDEMAVRPEEGLWGFDLPADDPAAKEFFTALLACMWRNRQHNERFRLYAKFPWDHRPQPAFRDIRLIRTDRMTPEEEAFITEALGRCVDGLNDSYVRVTPDYLVGWVYRSVKSTWTGTPDYYCVMPLGHVSAEVSLPRPDWQPFLVGHVLKEALGGGSSSGGPYLQDRRYLYVRGRGEDGSRLELAFDWYNPGDGGYEEAEWVVRFVEAMRLAREPSQR